MAEVKLYSTPTCPYCRMAKDFLDEQKVEVKVVDVSENVEAAREMVDKSGQMGVPVMEVENTIIVGNCRIDCKRRIVDSLIGSNAEITDSTNSVPRGSRFIIGENTVISM